MIYATHHAEDQLQALRAFLLKKERYDAYRNLIAAIREAKAQIEANPHQGLPHPKPYPGVARWGFLWIKMHRYWFGWSMSRGYPVVTNVLDATSRMWRRAKPKAHFVCLLHRLPQRR